MIISIFPSGERASYCLPLPNIIRHIKTGTYKEAVAKARQFYRQIEGRGLREALGYIPCFSPSGHFKGLLRRESLISFSGCILLETECIPNDLLTEVRQILENDPFTMACFQNVQGDRLEIIVRTGGTIENYQQYFQQLLEYFELRLPVSLNPEPDYPYRLCSMSFDPLAYFNPGASNFPATLSAPPPRPPVRKERLVTVKPESTRPPVLNPGFPELPSVRIPMSTFN